MNASMSRMRSVSAQIQGVGMRFMRNATSRMWPVRPMPPRVARKRSTLAVGAALDDAPVGHAQAQRRDVRAEAAVHVVVLAVDVGGHHAAEGDELRARRDGQEEAAGQEQPVELEHARARPRRAAGPSLRSKARMRSARVVLAATGPAGGRQRRVAVGAAEPAREHGTLGERGEILRALLPRRHALASPSAEQGRRPSLQIGRSTAGKLLHTGTPQKCSPSVQVGVMRPARSTQGGPMWRARRGWTART